MMLLISISMVYFVLSNINKLNNPILGKKPKNLNNKSTISSVLILQLIAVSPLFILGCDYSRWVSFWVISSFSILAFVPDEYINKIVPHMIVSLSKRCNTFIYNLFGDSKSLILVLMLVFGLPIVGWSLIRCAQASSLYVVLSTISSFIEYLFKALHIVCYQEIDLPLFE